MRASKLPCYSAAKKSKTWDVRDMIENGDRLSSLPEKILHHILSFLDMRYVVRTSFLSRRWRYLWTSLPNLEFDHLYFLSRTGGRDEAENGFMDFVDRVLLLRNSSDIQKFHISCGWYCDVNRVNSWVLVAVRRNVQEFYLKIRPKDFLELPDCLFTCKSLRVLKLDMDYVPVELRLPDSINLPKLKTLHLELVNLDEKLITKILSCCPVLETLILTMCQLKYAKNVIICSRQLKKLVIEACFMDHSGLDDCKINIWAPNLTYLKCVDYMSKEYFLGNLSGLISAELDMKVEESRAFEEIGQPPSERKQIYAQRMIKCLRGLSNAKSLTLSAYLLEMISEAPSYVLECLPTPFCNLRYLRLKTWLSRDCIRAIAYLLKCSPNIETLVLETSVKSYTGYEKQQLFFDECSCLYNHQFSLVICLVTFWSLFRRSLTQKSLKTIGRQSYHFNACCVTSNL
ncbi:PREDICTED: F-box/LRR-repeat protein At4g14103-like isoform X2 [Nelumbo nucifera]|uniref:F-box/LRR-repeat protein At4g14103-like isoform X2 n=2 Tax=Nelumbo nucifera TaxID=4432 RepID=A0A1U8B9P5_NELNU|nr:PREDICTED: F-box/LRR-repeat protein At4g14103-like isoform X2 [Nelumbo nucifera]DAD39626.1 TPA_asm: hypothetical protein HUJ06_013949 [Nelumbo nucifera]